VLALGLFLLVAYDGSAQGDKDSGALALSEADFNKLVAKSAKDIATILSKKPSADELNRARAAAAMIAAYAQFSKGGPSDEQRAAVQQAALKVAAALKAKKLDEAKKEAEALPTIKGDGSAKLVTGSLLKETGVPLRLIMRQMDPAPKGYGIEAHYKVLTGKGTAKKALPDALMTEDLVLTAFQVAVIAELAKLHTPEKGAKNVKEFLKFADEMQKTAANLADATKKKEGGVALAEVYRVTLTCNKCHAKFRED
jgi:hypothetical protein